MLGRTDSRRRMLLLLITFVVIALGLIAIAPIMHYDQERLCEQDRMECPE